MPTKNTSKKTTTRTAKKKTTSKKAAKKVVRKPGTARTKRAQQASTRQTCCTPQEAFWVHDGPVVVSLAELRQALRGMSARQYAYHTTRNGNDFARWIRDCLHDDEHALCIEKAKTKTGAVRALSMTCRTS